MNEPIIISIGGGKGGIGKSTLTANIGTLLSNQNFKIGFIDADLGGANLHLCLGVKRPQKGLQDYLSGSEKTLANITVETCIPNTWLISGASDIMELANPNFAQKQKVINQLKKLNADYLLIDLGAGTDTHVTDFYAAFPFGIIVMDSLPTSVENAYGFLKNGTVRGLMRLFPGNTELQQRLKSFADPTTKRKCSTLEEVLDVTQNSFPEETIRMREWLHKRKNFLIVNMVKGGDDIKVGHRFTEIVKKYISLNLNYIGYVIESSEIRTAIKEMRPAVLGPDKKLNECFDAITQNIITLTNKPAKDA